MSLINPAASRAVESKEDGSMSSGEISNLVHSEMKSLGKKSK